MTIKELRQLLKDSNLQEKGLLSKLKRKQDLVDYLAANLPKSNGVETITVNGDTAALLETAPRRKGPMGMPQLDDATNVQQQQQPDTSATTTATASDNPHHGRDAFFEYIYNMYPPLRDHPNNCTGLGEHDIRQEFHPMLQNATCSDFDIITVGTASCTPGITRGVSCTALRLNWRRRYLPTFDGGGNAEYSSFTGGTWLFDTGECTQLQVQRTTRIKPSKITKIFITHAHGDHSFGLPGLLCLMGQDRDRETAPPVDIYGPQGLRMWLRVAIRYSVARIVPQYRVHELMEVPMAPEWRLNRQTGRYFYMGHRGHQLQSNTKMNERWDDVGLDQDGASWIARGGELDLPPSLSFGELPGGRDIYPQYDHELARDGAPIWLVEDEDDVKVYAAPMSHGVPCVGYVVDEQARPGRLRNDYVEPIVKRNIQALKDAGFRIPMKAMAVIKNLKEGSSFTFPDGTVVTQEDAVEPPRGGRKVVICGDTADARALEGAAMDADVLVHEATNTFLPGIDKETNLKAVTKDAKVHGHSTPHIAADFAKKIRAKRLVLNHFSARYKGDQAVDSIAIMTRMEQQAIKRSGLNQTHVAAAWDFMSFSIPQN